MGWVREANWVPHDHALIKVPITSAKVVAFERALRVFDNLFRFSVAGNVAWIAWPAHQSLAPLAALLVEQRCGGMVCKLSASMNTVHERIRLGTNATGVFAERIQAAMDRPGRFHVP